MIGSVSLGVGSITIVNDLDLTINLVQNNYESRYKIIVVDQDGEFPIPIGGNVLGGSILLPPYEILSVALDGNYPLFMAQYYDYLEFNPYARDYISTIMASIYLGHQIILYIKPDLIADIPVQGVIVTYLQNRCYINPGIAGTVACAIMGWDKIIADSYKLGVISGWEYMYKFDGIIGSYGELPMLVNEYQQFSLKPINSEAEALEFLNGIRLNIRGQQTADPFAPISEGEVKEMIMPMSRADSYKANQ